MSKSALVDWRYKMSCCQDLKSTTKLVLHTIALHMNGAGESCYPTVRQIMYESGLSNRVVSQHINLAVKAGWLEKSKHGFGGQRWANNQYEPKVPSEYRLIEFADAEQKCSDGKSPRGSDGKSPRGSDGKSPRGSDAKSPPSEKGSDSNDAKLVTLSAEGSDSNDTKVVTESHTSSSLSSSISSSEGEGDKPKRILKPKPLLKPEKQKSPGLERFKREVNYTGQLAACGPAKLESVWQEIDGEQRVDTIIENINLHLHADTWKSKDDYRTPINHVLANLLWLHPPDQQQTEDSEREKRRQATRERRAAVRREMEGNQ